MLGRIPTTALTLAVVRGVGLHPVDPVVGFLDGPPDGRGEAMLEQVGHRGRQDGNLTQEAGQRDALLPGGRGGEFRCGADEDEQETEEEG